MAGNIKKAWIWTKLAAIILVVAWVALFLAFNWKHKVDLWLIFGVSYGESNVMGDGLPLSLIIMVTVVASILVFYVVRKITDVMHELSETRRKDREKEQSKRMETLAKQVENKLGTSGPKDKQSEK